jgi:hypothetical protein
MKDLLDFKNNRIEAMQTDIYKKQQRIDILETYIFELTDESCPQEYKKIVKNELLKTN